ncbi:recombination-associated protein RdgC [Sansalvadorimonas sp. 2012CJ34-2]|uniref:Recombination-associated protein RdgC n=1 Tax=Parendozoicomonas callyspongiae TaxID=2942213 RepID=A0ABT0PFP4_9GAMM|nr:recombination-associated protein RdgC [Sansalvadorimonas sp. 2012CJ34-2]MCL6270197.1 recombination-associated protein RdgC [Sansalvadorimonas sp. 2012CJ34-2]
MWFKNLVLYRFSQELDIKAEELEKSLAEQTFRPCGKTEMSTYGWVSPVPGGETLVHVSGPFRTFCARKEEKILPASVIRDAVNDKVQQIEADQGRQVFKKEKDQIKDEVTLDLLPRAFSKSNSTRAYIDTRSGWLIVDASSFRKAEELTSTLRSTLGSLPVVPPTLKHSPAAIMTQWLETHASSMPGSMAMGDECELKDIGEDGGVIRCKHQDLLADEITGHLATGMQVSRLSLHWNESISCVLGDDFLIRRVKFTDELQEQSEALNAEDDASRFDADFTLMAGTLSTFLKELVEGLGGEEEREERTVIGEISTSSEKVEDAPF